MDFLSTYVLNYLHTCITTLSLGKLTELVWIK